MKILLKMKKFVSGFTVLAMVLAFIPVNSFAASNFAVTGFKLIDPDTENEVAALVEGSIVNLAELTNGNTNVKAEVSDVNGQISSVVFNLDNGTWTRTESSVPFSLFGDSAGNYYATHTFTLGAHTLTAVPYTGTDGHGNAGDSLTVNFTVINEVNDDGEEQKDEVPPIVTGVEDGVTYYGPVNPCFTDESGATATLNGEPFDCSEVSDYGNYELVVTDGAGNSVTVNFSIVDREAPATPEHLTPADNAFSSSSALQKIDWTDVTDQSTPVKYEYESSISATVQAPGGEFISTVYKSALLPASEIPTPGTPDGIYYWHVRAQDSAGNSSLWSEPWMITVDSKAPEVNEIQDYLTNKAVTATLIADDENAAEGLNYSWTEPTSKVLITGANTHEATLTATEDGIYVVTASVTDRAGNTTSQTFNFVWDTTVTPVQFAATAGENYVDLMWNNPTDPDFVGVQVYRSLDEGERGEKQAEILGGQSLFSDNNVLSGVTYYYTLISFDELGNEAASEVVKVTTHLLGDDEDENQAPVLNQAVPGGTDNGSASGLNQQSTKPAEKEVKAATKEEQKKEETRQEEVSNLPIWGIVLLALVGLLGLYLLYQQYPEMFAWLFFWKKRRR